jgi:hypothetical protein
MKQAENVAHQKFDRVMQGWDDLERRMRQHWRIYPDRRSEFVIKKPKRSPVSSFADSEDYSTTAPINPGDILEMIARADLSPGTGSESPEHDIESSTEERTPIVSINGKDIDEADLDAERKDDKGGGDKKTRDRDKEKEAA